MKTNLKIDSQQLSNTLIVCGLICNILVGIIGLSIGDKILISFSAVLAVVSLASISLAFNDQAKTGTHLNVMAYLLVFITASFTHIVSYSLLLVYPIIIGFVNLYFTKKSVHYLYTGIAFIGSIVTIYNMHVSIWNELNIQHLIGSMIIAIGLLIGFLITIKVHSMRLNRYRDQRNEFEKSIIDKNNSLKDYIKTNLQLENFAHLASHDLKTPIKNISNFSQLLDRRLAGKLNSKDQEILDMVKMESHRMSEMMADLLKLSQLSKRKINYSKINGHNFINRLIEENFKLEKGFVAVNSFPLELVVAESHLNILFYNLIENAIRFCKTNEDPKVMVYGRRSQDFYYFEIKDNGIGIDDKYKKSVFLIFNKLNPAVSADGSGIGLSMCREIVHRHNGQIWIEDNVDGGSIVKFTLSRNLVTEQSDIILDETYPSFEAQIA